MSSEVKAQYFCSGCGAMRQQGAKRCVSCGRLFDDESNASETIYALTHPQVKAPYKERGPVARFLDRIFSFHGIMWMISITMILIAVGFIANKRLNLDSRTFAKIFIYIFVPAIFFTKIYYASVPLKEVWFILAYIMAIQLLMLVTAALCARIFAYSRSRSVALGNSLMFFNSGNYGLPLADLVDLDAERDRLQKALAEVEGRIARSQSLLASDFAAKAPEHVVQRERDKLADLQAEEAKLRDRLADLHSA